MQPLKYIGAADTVASGPEFPGKSQATQRQGGTPEPVRPIWSSCRIRSELIQELQIDKPHQDQIL